MPFIPYLTDNRENVEGLYFAAKDSRVGYVLPGTLYLRGKTRGAFFEFIQKEYPGLLNPLLELYKTGGVGKEYKDGLYKMVNALKEKYQLSGSYSALMKEKMHKPEYQQMSIFEL